MELQEKLGYQRDNFLDFVNKIGDLKNSVININEIKNEIKIKYDRIPSVNGILLLYEKDINK